MWMVKISREDLPKLVNCQKVFNQKVFWLRNMPDKTRVCTSCYTEGHIGKKCPNDSKTLVCAWCLSSEHKIVGCPLFADRKEHPETSKCNLSSCKKCKISHPTAPPHPT